MQCHQNINSVLFSLSLLICSPPQDDSLTISMGTGESKPADAKTEGPAAALPPGDIPIRQPSWSEQVSEGYEVLVNAIIRPPRAEYNAADLGPSSFTFHSKKFTRRDFTIANSRGQSLQCSWWGPHDDERIEKEMPVVVYLHGNASCRIGALSSLSTILANGMTCFAFDFAGSGGSDGEYVSLGLFEKEDLASVIQYIRASGTVSTIGLWGRSMGAVTALMYGSTDPSIAGMVLDSPFMSLYELCLELVDKLKGDGANGFKVPRFLAKTALHILRGSVQKRAGFDIYHVTPLDGANACFMPALFIASEGDDFIVPEHSKQLHAVYGGGPRILIDSFLLVHLPSMLVLDKNIILCEGDHNSVRGQEVMDNASVFLTRSLQVPDKLMLASGHNGVRLPWSSTTSSRNMGYDYTSTEDLILESILFRSAQEYNMQASIIKAVSPREGGRYRAAAWNCPLCTFRNEDEQQQCEVCNSKRPAEQALTSRASKGVSPQLSGGAVGADVNAIKLEGLTVESITTGTEIEKDGE